MSRIIFSNQSNQNLFVPLVKRRSRPLSLKFFNAYTKYLAVLTGNSFCRSREALAIIYGYRVCHELYKCPAIPGELGRFDDENSDAGPCATQIQAEIWARTERAMAIVLARYDLEHSRPDIVDLHDRKLFSSPSACRHAFNRHFW